MAGQLLLLNPSTRKRARSRKPRSAAQKAATRRMVAANRARRGARPVAKRRAKRRASPVFANPSPLRRRRRSVAAKVRRAHRKYKRNPIGLPKMSGIMHLLTNAAVGGAGAIGVDYTMAKVAGYLPASMNTKYDTDGSMNYSYAGIKLALAVATATVLPKVLPGRMKQYAVKAGEGSLTVQAYDIMKHFVPASMTLGYMQPAQLAGRNSNVVGMGKYVNGLRGRGMGRYLNASFPAGSANPIYAGDERVGEGAVK